MWDLAEKHELEIELTAPEFSRLVLLGYWDTHELTDKGLAFLTDLLESEDKPLVKFSDKFEKWWVLWPPTTDGRSFRIAKNKVYNLYQRVILQFDEDELFSATENYISRFAMEASTTGSPFRWMKGPASFLADGVYKDVKAPDKPSYDSIA